MTRFDRESWDERYRDAESVWSRNPNPQLVAEASNLTPGRALDVGCGEGTDALWMAGQGWRVTAVDFSQPALDRGAARAAAASGRVAERISWEQHDLLDRRPEHHAYDLVSSQFMHLPSDQLPPLFARLADSVAAGGTLLVVGHHVSDVSTGLRPDLPEMFFTATEVAQQLGYGWSIDVAEERARSTPGPDGDDMVVHDTVLRATRESTPTASVD